MYYLGGMGADAEVVDISNTPTGSTSLILPPSDNSSFIPWNVGADIAAQSAGVAVTNDQTQSSPFSAGADAVDQSNKLIDAWNAMGQRTKGQTVVLKDNTSIPSPPQTTARPLVNAAVQGSNVGKDNSQAIADEFNKAWKTGWGAFTQYNTAVNAAKLAPLQQQAAALKARQGAGRRSSNLTTWLVLGGAVAVAGFMLWKRR